MAGLVAFTLVCLAAYHFRFLPDQVQSPELIYTAYLLPVALLLTLTAFAWAGAAPFIRALPAPAPASSTGKGSVPRWLGIVGGLSALALLTAINARWLPLIHLGFQLALLILGAVALVWGFAGRYTPVPHRRRWSWHKTGVLAVILVALAARLYTLETLVPHFVDEVLFATGVVYARVDQGMQRLLMPMDAIAAFPVIYGYLMSVAVEVLGTNMIGLRLVSVFTGTLTVAAVYLLGRQLVDKHTALLAAFLLAAFPPHLAFSRIGLNNIADPLFGVLALAFLVRGWRQGGAVHLALAGVMLGMTQYFYEMGRLLFPILFILFIDWGVWRQRQRLRASLRRYLPFVIAALAIGLPIYLTLLLQGLPLTARANDSVIDLAFWQQEIAMYGWSAILPQLLNPFLVFVHLPETGVYYGSPQALLLTWMTPFFLLGLMTVLFHWRRPTVVLIPWFLLLIGANFLIETNRGYARYVVSFPAIALVSAIGVRAVLDWLMRPWWSRSPSTGQPPPLLTPRRQQVALLLVGLAAAALHLGYFFGPHQVAYRYQVYSGRLDEEGTIRRSLGYPAGWPIYIFATWPSGGYLQSILNYFGDTRTLHIQPIEALTPEFKAALPRDRGLLMYIAFRDVAQLQMLMPDFQLVGPYYGPDNVPGEHQFALYLALPPGVNVPPNPNAG
jgi:hypothetical protein